MTRIGYVLMGFRHYPRGTYWIYRLGELLTREVTR